MNPLVTIAIPTLDRLEYLKEAVTSARAQTYTQLEVLIGDDGTTKEIEAWGRKICSIDSRMRYQRNRRCLGLAGNWNALADEARGEFLVIIGDDDRLLPDFVARLVEIMPSPTQLAFSNHYVIDSKGVRLEAESKRLTQRYHRDELPAGEVVSPAVSVWRNSIPMSASMLRTLHVQRLRFKEDLNTPEIEFFARLAQEGGRFVFTPEYLSEYRVHGDSATASGLRGEALVKHLAPIAVAADVEPYKREFMGELLVNSVTRCLLQGNRKLAREFLAHEYYPRLHFGQPSETERKRSLSVNEQNTSRILRALFTRKLQGLCTWLPGSIGCSTYRLLQTTRYRLSGHP